MKKVGAVYQGNNCVFRVWAPEKKEVSLHIVFPNDSHAAMLKEEDGYFSIELKGISPGTRYFFSVEGKDHPDPASYYQPEGVHGPSEVIDHTAYQWKDDTWRGLPFRDLIFYELHVGTFTEEGTFEAIIPLLDDLADTGINAIEIMPVAQFPGNRNWGYDGTYPYAIQNSYGGPEGLKKLTDACHQKGIAVFIDAVYNHIGPEGNYLPEFAPYFTDKYATPWGNAINFDSDWSDEVKEYFSDNVTYLFENYHIDGLRLDAIHFIFDINAVTFWDVTYRKVKLLEQKLGRQLYMVAESDYNSPKVVKHPDNGGFGLDAQWLDDFHHSLYVMLDSKGRSRYEDYGKMEQLAKAYTDGFVHSGEYVKFRKRKHGASSAGLPGDKFVVFNLNHDQVGNRVGGERLSMLVDFERLKLAAAALLLSPYVPMLFMGEEYGEDVPFFYFVSHSDKDLIKAVREGRKKEFQSFASGGEEFPDPQSEETFSRSKLIWHKRKEGNYKKLLDWHKELISLRRTKGILQNTDKNNLRISLLEEKGFIMHRQSGDGRQHILCLFNFSEDEISCTLPSFKPEWNKMLDSAETKWLPQGSSGTGNENVRVGMNKTIKLKPCSVSIYG